MLKIFASFVVLVSGLVHPGLNLELRGKAYEDLVVRINDDVPAKDCRNIVMNLENTLTGASQFLFSALDGRTFLRSVTVVLPNSWPDSCSPLPVVSGVGERPDVTVQGGDAVHRSIWTQQSVGCGQNGDQIYMEYDGLKSRDDKLGRKFVKEFAKYRYGVFDEEGYSNDPIYPMCYFDSDNHSKVTGCADLGTTDNKICIDPKARYNVTSIIDSHSRTSIMFAAEAPHVSMFCDEGNHNRLAPTKHNFMCERRSTLDVILSHPDFLRRNDDDVGNDQITDTTPKITYKKQNLTRYVLIIENTKEMLQRESWSFLRLAIRKWALYDLPDNTEVGLVLTNETNSQILLNISPLKSSEERFIGSNRDLVSSSVPYTPGDSTQASCLHCAVGQALVMLNERAKVTGPASSVILIIAPGMNTNEQLQAKVEEVKKEKAVKIVTVNYPLIARKSPLDILAKETNGDAFTVFEKKLNIDTSVLSTYFELSTTLYDIVRKYYSGNQADLPIEIHRREITNNGRGTVTGSFMLDASLGEPARFMLYTHNSDSPLIRGFKLTSPSHQIYSSKSETMLNVKVISVVANISETGTWTYTIEPYEGNPQPHFLQVMATPRSARAPVVNARFWTHRSNPNSPLVLLAEVKRGAAPVMGANVEVLVKKYETNGTLIYKDRFELLDTGGGDPDIVKGDGIYSRYYSAAAGGPGYYSFEAVISDNGNVAYSWQNGSRGKGDKPCCGSIVPSGPVENLASFQRYLPPVNLEISSNDIVSAGRTLVGRIGDLKAEVLRDELKVRLSWTAPDMGGQMVSNYEIRYALDAKDMLPDNFDFSSKTWEVGSPFILSPGSETTFTVDLSEMSNLLDRPIYFAVKAFQDPREVRIGTVSNWARVWVTSPPTSLPPVYVSSDQPSWPYQVNSIDSDNINNPKVTRSGGIGLELILPIVIGFVLLVILLALYCYFCVLRHRKREQVKTPTKPEKHNTPVTIFPNSPTNNAPAYTPTTTIDVPDPLVIGVPINNYVFEEDIKKRYSLVHHQEQQLIDDLRQEHHQHQQQQQFQKNYSSVSVISTTLQRNGQPLSPYNSWSASQLLHEHERRQSPIHDEQLLQHHQEAIMDQVSLGAQGEYHGHPPPVPPLPTYNGYPVGYASYGGQPIYQRGNEHIAPYTQSLQGSLTSVNSGDKKRRNVTMV